MITPCNNSSDSLQKGKVVMNYKREQRLIRLLGYLLVVDVYDLPDMIQDAAEAAANAKDDEEFMTFISKDNPFYMEGIMGLNDGELLNVFGSLVFPTSGSAPVDMLLELLVRSDLNELTNESALSMYMRCVEVKKLLRTSKVSHVNMALDAMTDAFGGGPSGILPRREAK